MQLKLHSNNGKFTAGKGLKAAIFEIIRCKDLRKSWTVGIPSNKSKQVN